MPTLYARLEQFILALSPRSWRFWLVCAIPSLPVFVVFTYTTFYAWRFADHGQQTSGRVTAIGCTGRGEFRYVYAVAGHDFGGQGHPISGMSGTPSSPLKNIAPTSRVSSASSAFNPSRP